MPLAQAAVWAAGEPPPVEVCASPTVGVATHYSPGANAYTILMVNHTTNEQRPQLVVRHVEPIVGTTITLREARHRVRDVQSLTEEPVEWSIGPLSRTSTMSPADGTAATRSI